MIKELVIKGAVQGVGYRPFIASKAEELNIRGFVKNLGAEVLVVAIGQEQELNALVSYVHKEVPPGGYILHITEKDIKELPPEYGQYKDSFSIIDSSEIDLSSDIPVFLPDIGICDDCQREIFDKRDYRRGYGLNSCAVCGPRMSILKALPYDRDNTTMGNFGRCPYCDMDYKKGRRRFAQTISCNSCGPEVVFDYPKNDSPFVISGSLAVDLAIKLLKKRSMIGLKGVGGYQFVAKPDAETARRLRALKGRENKPFAIMFFDIDMVKEYAYVSEKEEELLKSSARPIVLLKKKYDFDNEVVKDSRYIGAFLPSAGFHSILTKEFGPLIVTSANRSDEPIITDDKEFISTFFDKKKDADERCDGILYHKREITMPMDDSVMFVTSNKHGEQEHFLRRSRGFVPLPVLLDREAFWSTPEKVVFAFGADLKSTFAFGHNDKILLSQHIGDLADYSCASSYEKLVAQYKDLFKQVPNKYVCDLHPDYVSTKMAKEQAKKDNVLLIQLQHHYAHTYSVMAENSLTSAIGISFDGTGYGTDGCIWGGEFLYCNGKDKNRFGHLSYVTLTGADNASKDAMLVRKCYEHMAIKENLLDEDASSMTGDADKQRLIDAAIDNNVQTFECSSVGRLFDAVSALLGIREYNSYEGECAIMLENNAWEFEESGSSKDYPEFKFDISSSEEDGFIVNQVKLFADICKCKKEGIFDVDAIAYGFHMALIDLVVKGCEQIKEKTGENKVCLSGGVFNNRLLLSKTMEILTDKGFLVYSNKAVPLGDGGISLGQAYYMLMALNR